MADNQYQRGPLSHLRVLDLTDEKGHLCGKFLADLGAEVIKVEPPAGDPARKNNPFVRDDPDGTSLLWSGNNTGKKSLSLSLTESEGCAIFRNLVKKADLIVESFTPGYLTGLGIDYEQLKAINHRIVVTSITPFGQTGPYAKYEGVDLTIIAMSGFMFTCGEADRPPVRISVEQAYTAAGAQAASASLLALQFSRLNGCGQQVDFSIRDCLPRGGFETFFWETEGYVGERLGIKRRRANVYIRDLWPCKDGYIGWRLMVGALGAPTINNLVTWMDNEGMAGELKDIRWETVDMTRINQEQMDRWDNLIIAFFKTHTKAEIYQVALKHSMLMAPAFNVKEILDYPQLKAREFWTQVEHPGLNCAVTYPGAFCKMSESPLLPPRAAPGIGQDNEAIYVGELGLSREQLASFKSKGVI
jgi:benzylsuccinate CoA-transferase BbsE subunit